MISVLYVDDEADLLELGKHVLEKGGQFSVTTYTSAPDALASLKSMNYDAIIADYRMPGMNGIEFLQAIRDTGRSTPFIIFTGKGEEDTAILALNAGADYYLKKGGETISLFTQLGEVVRTRVMMRQAVIDLADEDQRYRDIQNANDLIQSVTPDGHFLFVNNKWLDTLQYKVSDIDSLTIFDIIHEECLEHCMDTFRKVIAGENVGVISAIFKTRTGAKVFVEGMATCRMADGKPVFTRGIFKDVTARKLAEAADEERKQTFEALVEQSSEGIIIVDFSGTLLLANSRAAEIIESREKVDTGAGINILDFISPELRENAIRDLMQVAAGTDGYLVSYKIVTLAKNERWVECIGKKISFKGAPAMLLSFRDVTERRQEDLGFQAMVKSMVGTTDIESLDRITESISGWLGADCVMIGEILPDGKTVGVLSMILDGKKVTDFSYTMEGTPCDNVAHKGFCVYPDEAQTLFPDAKDLRDLNIRGYLGTPLRNSSGQVIGVLCVLTQKPLHVPQGTQEIIDIIAVKAAAEIERRNALVTLRESEEKFRAMVEQSTEGITIIDFTGNVLFSNSRAWEIVDLPPDREKPASFNVLNVIAPDSQKNAIRDIKRHAAGIETILANYHVITLAKRDKWVECVGKKIRYKGAPALLLTFRDITERRRTELAVHESEKKFRSIFENSPYPICINSIPEGRFLAVNASFLKTSEYLEDEVLGKNPKELGLISLIDFGRLTSRFLLAGRIENVPLVLTGKEGKRIHVQFSTIPVTINDKPAIMTMAAEVTKLKRVEEELLRKNDELHAAYEQLIATEEQLRQNYDTLIKKEQALNQSEERYRSLFENMLEGFAYCRAVYDASGNPDDWEFLKVNQAFSNVTGLSDVIGKRMTETIPGIRELNPELFQIYGRVALTGKSETFEIYLKSLQKWLNISLYSPEKESLALVFNDITQRKEAEQALRESEKRYRDIFEINSVVMLIIDPETGRIVDANAAAGTYYGYTQEEFDRLTIMEINTADPASTRKDMARALEQGGAVFRFHHRKKSGELRDVEVFSAPILLGDHRYLHSIIQDVTESRRAEEALFKANEKLNTLSSITRHDILNQLNVLLGYLGMSKEDAKGKEMLNFLVKVEIAAMAIQRQIEFTRAYQDIGVKAPEWMDVARKIDSAFRQLHPSGINLENSIAGLEIFVDSLVEKVFYNLIENSIRHGGHVTTVGFSADETENGLILRYRDNGVGITEKDKKKLFLKEFGRNTGLGLFLSREILSITGITITENGEPGEGARFEIMVPKGAYRFVGL